MTLRAEQQETHTPKSMESPNHEAEDLHYAQSPAISQEHGEVELTRPCDTSPASPLISAEVHHLSGEDGSSGDQASQQQLDIAVTEVELGSTGVLSPASSPQVFRGIDSPAPAPSFVKLLKKHCNSCIIFLLFLYSVLSTGIGIQQQGLRTGWFEGGIVMNVIVILVVAPAIRDYWVQISTNHNVVVQTEGTSMGNQLYLTAQLDKVVTCSQVIWLVSSIIILVGQFIRSRLLGTNNNSGLELKGKPTASNEIINAIGEVFMKPTGSQRLGIPALLVVLLVGIIERIPLSVTLAITYWNKKILPAGKAIAQGRLAICTMGSATTICINITSVPNRNSLKIHKYYIGDRVGDEDSAPVTDAQVREAFCSAIQTSVQTLSNLCGSTQNQLLLWAKSDLGMENDHFWQNCSIVETKKLSTEEEASGVLMKGNENGDMWLHWEGPATTIVDMCSHYYDSKGRRELICEQKRVMFNQSIEDMHSKQLKTIAFAYKKLDVPVLEEHDLTLIGLVGVKYYCKEMMEVKDLQKAGVKILLFSDDSMEVVQDIARTYGILPNSDGSVINGESLLTREKIDMVDTFCGMANSSPSGMLLFVQYLKENGNIVAMVVARTDDEIPTLKIADVRISMGTRSTEMERNPESCDIIILDDSNISLLVKMIRCGRCIYHNTQKYIQLEVTTNMICLCITSILTLSVGNSPITTIELLWANTVLMPLSGVALLMEQPTEELMEKPPVRQSERLISKEMWRNILIQSLCQAAIIITFQFKGQALLGISEKVSESIMFNSYVLCQVFNQVNARQPERKNVFRGILHYPWFWVSLSLTLTLQLAFIEIAHIVAGNARLSWAQWGVCLLIGMASWPIDLAGKCASDVITNIYATLRSPASDSASNREILDGMV